MSNNKTELWTTVGTVVGGVAALIAAITPFIKSESETQPTPTPTSSPSQVKVNSPPVSGVRFFCGTGEYRGRNVPATIVKNTQSNEEVIVILWKLDNYYFGENYPPQKRCKMVSERFQNIYDRDGLKYVVATLETWVPNREIQVVCGVKQMMAPCHNEDLLFTLESTDNPDLVVQDVIDQRKFPRKNPPILRGEEHPNTFAEGKRVYYDFSGVLNRWQLEEFSQEKPAY
ncbi:MAG: COP23 domain-containing protein [Cyanobacteria bacterium P01_H01_bin.35]